MSDDTSNGSNSNNTEGEVTDQTDYKKIAEEVQKLLKPVDVEAIKTSILAEVDKKITAAGDKVDKDALMVDISKSLEDKFKPKEVDINAVSTQVSELLKDKLAPQTIDEAALIAKVKDNLKPPEPRKVKVKFNKENAAKFILKEPLDNIIEKEGE